MIEEIRDKLKHSGYKLTPQRLEIIRILIENGKKHLSLNDVHNKIKEKLPTVSFSTLYNTLQTLEKLSVIRLFNFQGETRIEVNMKSHINLIQKNTGKIIDIDNESLIREIASKLEINEKESKDMLINIVIYNNIN